jgi:hypothetical protein
MMDTSSICSWLTEQLSNLPAFSFPFDLKLLPINGIYFFYEKGEASAHGDQLPRIVRIGTHKDGNFRSRIAEHYLFDDRKMLFDQNRPAPHERSIFRKNIGRVILNRSKDPYLDVWERDFVAKKSRQFYGHLRDLDKERQIETQVTEILRKNFSFRYVAIEDQKLRLGADGLERHLIGTVAQCSVCGPSSNWLGQDSPDARIRSKGLWQVQHLNAPPLSEDARSILATKFCR